LFTGIIDDLGTVAKVEPLDAGCRLVVSTSISTADVSIGESITVNGACMTVTGTDASTFAFDVSLESLRRTTLGELGVGAHVNLERSVRMSDRLGGHLVSGHVDGVGSIESITAEGESAIYRFEVPEELCALLVEKGSVAVDGISLTCFNCRGGSFDVAVIPHTAEVTTLGRKTAGARVNLETDMIGKYVARLLEPVLDARRRGQS
jgi:riboflavin synthase